MGYNSWRRAMGRAMKEEYAAHIENGNWEEVPLSDGRSLTDFEDESDDSNH